MKTTVVVYMASVAKQHRVFPHWWFVLMYAPKVTVLHFLTINIYVYLNIEIKKTSLNYVELHNCFYSLFSWVSMFNQQLMESQGWQGCSHKWCFILFKPHVLSIFHDDSRLTTKQQVFPQFHLLITKINIQIVQRL